MRSQTFWDVFLTGIKEGKKTRSTLAITGHDSIHPLTHKSSRAHNYAGCKTWHKKLPSSTSWSYTLSLWYSVKKTVELVFETEQTKINQPYSNFTQFEPHFAGV